MAELLWSPEKWESRCWPIDYICRSEPYLCL